MLPTPNHRLQMCGSPMDLINLYHYFMKCGGKVAWESRYTTSCKFFLLHVLIYCIISYYAYLLTLRYVYLYVYQCRGAPNGFSGYSVPGLQS